MSALSGEPWRGLAKVNCVDSIANLFARSYTVSIVDVTPDTATGDQSTWEGNPGTSVTLRLEWDERGTPPANFGPADTCTVNVRLPGDASNIGSTWTPTISGASGSATVTMHFDSDPLNASAGSARCGMLEVYFNVSKAAAPAWGSFDSRGAAANVPPATTPNHARGYLRAPVILSAESLSNASLGGAEPASFAFPDTIFHRFTLSADLYRANSVTMRHRQSGTNRRSNTSSSTTSATGRDFTLNTSATTEAGSGRYNNSFTSGLVDIRLELTTITFDADSEYVWASTGHTGGYSRTSELILDDPSRYTGNPAITLANVATGQTVYNREETATHQFNIVNARSENLTLAATWNLRSGSNLVVGLSGSGAPYSSSRAIGVGEFAAYDLVGDQWNIITTFADATAVSANVYKVSRMWQFSTSAVSINNGVFVGKAVNPTSDTGVFRNRGQTVFFDAYVYNVRGVLLAAPTINFNARPVWSETFDDTNDTEPLVGGRFTGAGASYTVDTDEASGAKALVIGSQFATSPNQSRSGLLGSGNFAETSLVNFTTPDGSSNGRTGTMIGNTDMKAPPLHGNGASGYSFEFEGTNRGVDTSAVNCGAFGLSGSTGCVECRFIQTVNPADFEALVSHFNDGSSNAGANFYLGITNGRNVFAAYANAATGPRPTDVVGTTTIALNTRYAVAMDWDGATMRVWLKNLDTGVTTLEGSAACTQMFDNIPAIPLYLGRAALVSNLDDFGGRIDHVRISTVSRYPANFIQPEGNYVNDGGTAAIYELDDVTSGGAKWLVSRWGRTTRHLQINDVLLTPALNTNARPIGDIGYFGIKALDASLDEYNGAVGVLTLRDDKSLAAAVVSSSLTTAAENGHNGYTPLQSWTTQLPTGGFDLWASTDFIHNGNTWTLPRRAPTDYDFVLQAFNSALIATGRLNHGVLRSRGLHLRPGDKTWIVCKLTDITTGLRVVPESGAVFLTHLGDDAGQIEMLSDPLDNTEAAWVLWGAATPGVFFPLAPLAGDVTILFKEFAFTNGWKDDVLVGGYLRYQGTNYPLTFDRELMGHYNAHAFETESD